MRSRRPTFVISIVLSLALTLGLAVMIMRPTPQELLDLTLIFVATGLGATVMGFLSVQVGWWKRVNSLIQSLTIGHLLAAFVGFAIVLVAARLMFINTHDLALAGVLLFFASSVAVSFGYFFSNSITERLKVLDRAAQRLSRGEFTVRVEVLGKDEVAQLGQAFNAMAAQLEDAEKESRRLEAARRDFIAGASHDLRTPLTSLRAMLDAIADGVVEDPTEYIGRSQRVIAQMSKLADDLVELAQLDSGAAPIERTPSSVSEVIDGALERAALKADARGVQLRGSAPTGLASVLMEESRIGRVLQNLLDNAINHTEPGGEVRVSAMERNGTVEVTVRDSGAGIPPEVLPNIFERFYRGERSRARGESNTGGVGLGLAIARELVVAHGGAIWAESAPERGTSITFALPREGER